jgi:D-sedoheptulose 7-phosphate isomerase
MDADSAYDQWTDMTVQVRNHRRTVFLIGNGASASMASHVAADLAKNGHVRTEVFTDLSLITAIANDVSFEAIFSEPLSRRLSEGDMVVAISSSGRSQNIVRAVELTRERGGCIITLSAMRPDNPLRGNGELNFYIPADTYGMAETCHAALLHYWIDKVISW